MSRRSAIGVLTAMLLAAGLAAVAAGCGGESGKSGGGTTAATESTSGKAIKVGLVTDIGGIHDRGFNQLAFEGLQRAETRLGVTGRLINSKSNADYVPNLSSLARQDYDLVIAVGFLMADATAEVAKRFPDTHFAIVDVDQTTLKGTPPNVQGLIFREQEGGYLIGYLAGLVTKSQGGEQTVGVVGGVKIPPVDRFAAGYTAGAKAANPGITVLRDYSQDFVDQAKCKEIALNHIASGSQVEFADAGACGLGVLDAAKEKHVWGLGGDADQAYLGPHVLSSELKKVDVAVFDAIKSAQDGSFKGGGNQVFTVANGGIDIGKISPKVSQDTVDKVQAVKRDVGSGKISGIPTTVP